MYDTELKKGGGVLKRSNAQINYFFQVFVVKNFLRRKKERINLTYAVYLNLQQLTVTQQRSVPKYQICETFNINYLYTVD